MPTPGDLRAMRTLLGLSREECGELLGGLTGNDVRKLEHHATWFVREGHAKLLEELLARVNSEIDGALAGKPPPFLITYPNFDVLKQFEPERAAWMLVHSVHMMFTARLLDAWMVEGARPEVLQLFPSDYARFREDKGLPDNIETRLAWAADYRPQIKLRPGLPGRRDD